jgi:tetratricopeptide (TPR) repeat protein
LEAEKHYQRALEVKEDYAEAHADYAFLLANLKRYEESKEHYLRAIEIEEKWIDAAFLYGELAGLCEERSESKQAEICYVKVLEISLRVGHKFLQDRSSLDLARVRRNLDLDLSST